MSAAIPTQWTVRNILQWSANYLVENGSASARLDAEILLAESLDCKRMDLYLEGERPISLAERAIYKECIRRRVAGEPVAYIIERKGFWRHDFKVNAAVLIPRPETEILVEKVLEENQSENMRVLDVGAGSGCIALSLAAAQPSWSIVGWDVSEAALAVAKENAQNLEIENCLFECRDMADQDLWKSRQSCFDFVVANPPYISRGDEAIEESVRQFEPHSALFSEQDGLAHISHLIRGAGELLDPGGKLYFEMGYQQEEAARSLCLPDAWTDVVSYIDLAGRPRVLRATKR